MAEENLESVRLDKWLWAARFFKTRTLSQDNIELGRIKVNGARVKPSKDVKVGDKLEIIRGQEKLTVFVQKLSSKRGGAPEAQKLYQETEESLRERMRIKELNSMVPSMPHMRGRPTKRDGRKLRELMDEFASGQTPNWIHD